MVCSALVFVAVDVFESLGAVDFELLAMSSFTLVKSSLTDLFKGSNTSAASKSCFDSSNLPSDLRAMPRLQ